MKPSRMVARVSGFRRLIQMLVADQLELNDARLRVKLPRDLWIDEDVWLSDSGSYATKTA
jgi:hypothetical protein